MVVPAMRPVFIRLNNGVTVLFIMIGILVHVRQVLIGTVQSVFRAEVVYRTAHAPQRHLLAGTLHLAQITAAIVVAELVRAVAGLAALAPQLTIVATQALAPTM